MPIMRYHHLAMLAVAVGLLLAGLGAGIACNGEGSGQPSTGNPGLTQDEQAATATAVQEQQEMIGEFFEAWPLKSYTSFEEAEQVAGYHIPRASDEYPVAFGLTHLQWFPQFERPISNTEYTYPPLAPTSMGVVVGPSYFFGGDEESVAGKEHTTVGGKSGWLKEGDMSFFFDFICGEVDGYNVWCGASAPKEVGWETFEHFVSTLE
jgi:hypothetical protein